MTASELFREGQLAKAIAAQVEAVKAAPTDLGRRTFLFELHAFAGDFERAERQLSVLEQQNMELGLAVGAYRQCLEGELARRKVFSGDAEPAFLREPPDDIRHQAEALRLIHADRLDDARQTLAAAAAARGPVSGKADGADFAEFRDADDLLGPVFEFFNGPLYTWVPIAEVRSVTFTEPKKPRDLLWNVCELAFADGTTRQGVIPVLYPNTHESEDDLVRLGRSTDWLGYEGGPAFGQGMRTFLIDGEERGMLEFKEITFGEGDL